MGNINTSTWDLYGSGDLEFEDTPKDGGSSFRAVSDQEKTHIFDAQNSTLVTSDKPITESMHSDAMPGSDNTSEGQSADQSTLEDSNNPLPPKSNKPDSSKHSWKKPLLVAVIILLLLGLVTAFALYRNSVSKYNNLKSAQSALQQELLKSEKANAEELKALGDKVSVIRGELDKDIPEDLQAQYQDLLIQINSLTQSSNQAVASSAQDLLAKLTNQAGAGISLSPDGKTITNSGVLSVNNQTGNLSIQGTANQTNVTQNGATTTIGTVQDIAQTSSPTFNNQTLTGNGNIQGGMTVGGTTTTNNLTIQSSGTQNGYALCDASNNCGYSGAGSSYVQGGNSFGNPAYLGTNDNNSLNLETNGTTRLTIDTAGNTGLTGNLTTPGSVSASSLSGNGSGVTNVDATALNGNTAGNNSGQIALNNGTINSNLNSDLLDGQHGSYYQNAGNINAGTLSDARLSSNVTLQGNSFNGINQLVQLNGSGYLPSLNGSLVTNVDALTLQGNGASYYTNASNQASGTLSDARLSSNIPLKNATNTFIGTNNFAGLTATGILQGGYSVCDTSNNCNYAPISGSGNYIQNQTATPQVAGFNISGDGIIGGRLGIGVASSPLYGINLRHAGATADLLFNRVDSNSVKIGAYWGGSTAYGLMIEDNISSINSFANGYGLILGNRYSTNLTTNSENDQVRIQTNNFNPTSGSARFNILRVGGGSINQTGSANGTTRGILIDQVITSATDWRALDINTNVGYGIYQGGSNAFNYFQGNMSIGSSSNLGKLAVVSSSSSQASLVVRGASGQMANLQEWQNSSGTVLSRVASNGNIQLGFNVALQGEYSGGGNFVDLIKRGNGNSVYIASTMADTFVQGGTYINIQNASGNGLRLYSSEVVKTGSIGYLGTGSTPWNQLWLQPTTSTATPLYVRGAVSQSANLTEWQSNTGIVQGYVNSSGYIQMERGFRAISAGLAGGSYGIGWGGTQVSSWTADPVVGDATFTSIGGKSIYFKSSAIGDTALKVKAFSGQTADLQQWLDPGGVVLAKIDSGGNLQLTQGNSRLDIGTSQNGYLSIGTQNNYSANFINKVAACFNTACLSGDGGGGVRFTNSSGQNSTGRVVSNFVGVDTLGSSSNGKTAMQITEVLANTKAHVGFNITPASGVAALFGTSNVTNVNLAIKGISGQTGDLLQAQDSSGVVLAKIDASGNLTVKNASVEGAYITFSNNIRGYNVGVTASATSQTVSFNTAHPDANYAVFCTPDWNTSCYVTNKTTNGFTLNYGTAAPAAQQVDWFVAR